VGSIRSTLVNLHRDRTVKPEPFTPAELALRPYDGEEAVMNPAMSSPRPAQSWRQMKAMAEVLCSIYNDPNGKDNGN
jgi:hypothetical protein